MIGWTLGGFDTEIGRIEECVVGTLGDASVFDIGESLVDKIILGTSGSAGSICIKSEGSKGTEIDTFF